MASLRISKIQPPSNPKETLQILSMSSLLSAISYLCCASIFNSRILASIRRCIRGALFCKWRRLSHERGAGVLLLQALLDDDRFLTSDQSLHETTSGLGDGIQFACLGGLWFDVGVDGSDYLRSGYP